MSVEDTIVSIARGYIGQQEVQPNQSFKDPVFLKKMLGVGWYRTASWCSFFAKLVWKEAYTKLGSLTNASLVNRYASGSSRETWNNFRASKEFKTSTTVPKVGAIVIWQEGDSLTNGHVGIVTAVNGNTFSSVEGNTNADGSRNGYEVAEHTTHKVGLPHSVNGLNVLGFVYPVEV
jgi:hypothetical protein